MGISYSGFGESTSKLSGLAVSPPGALTAKYNNAPSWITPSGSLGAANGGVVYTFNFQAIDEENDTITYNIVSGTLPSGISLSGNQLVGTPVNNPGNYTFTISISDGNFSVNRTFNLDITNQTPIWNTAAGVLGSTTPNTPSSYTLSASDPNGDTITFSITNGSLPSGMTLSGNVISGTPSTTGTSNFTITASDGKGGNVDRAFSIIVSTASYVNKTFTYANYITTATNCIGVAHDGTNLYYLYYVDRTDGKVYKNGTLFFTSAGSYDLTYSDGVIYSTPSNQPIYKHSAATGTLLGSFSDATSDHVGLAVRGDKIYSAQWNGTIKIFSLTGTLLTSFTDSHIGSNYEDRAIAIDPSGNLFIMTTGLATPATSNIFVYTSANGLNFTYLKTITLAAPPPNNRGMCFNPSNGDLYIATHGHNKIYRYTSS
jgi:hypothetical protein